jgi:predicted membrane-bound dolichyl-phosphate-mannose-protein mannosyltransferase
VGAGAAVLIGATMLPWSGIGGGPGELPARGDVGISDLRGLLIFLAAAACLLLVTVRYAAGTPVAIDRPVAYLGLLAVAGAAYVLRVVDLAGQALVPWPPDRGLGFWLVPAGLALLGGGVAVLLLDRGAAAIGPEPASLADEAASPDSESRGRLDLLDAWVVAGLLVAVLAMRLFGLGQPARMYFDEVYHARTATEFLQEWRYGIPHDIYEWTHPMLAKYAIAGGIALFSDDRVTATADLGVTVEDAVGQGDRIFVATGSEVRAYDLATRALVHTYAIPGAAALSEPTAGGLVYVGTVRGAIYAMDTRSLDPPALLAVNASFAIAHVYAGTPPYVLVSDATGNVVSVDTSAGGGSISGRGVIPGAADFAAFATAGTQLEADATPRILVAYRDGVGLLDARTLTIESTVATSSPATSLAFDREAGDYQRIYVAAGQSVLLLSATADSPSIVLEGYQPLATMPGPVTEVVVDEATGVAHALGRTPDGAGWTVYAIETNGNAVFSDAVLPFEPIAIGLDNAVAPQADRAELLAFGADGSIASVDVGQFAFSWRVVGVLFGALMAVCLYLLARILFRRRSVGLLVAFFSIVDGMFFAQSRIATNDTYVGGWLLLAYLIFAVLWLQIPRSRYAFWLGMPVLGTVLGLALASKWVAIFAIGSMLMLILIRSALGRLVTILGLAVATGVLGWLAIGDGARNFTFFAIMLAVTALAAAANSCRPVAWSRPGWRVGVRTAWTMFCIAILPLVIYVVSYIPWAMPGQSQAASGAASTEPLPAIACWHVDRATGVCDNAWPAGHTGQTLWDLTVRMYDYHNDLRAGHAAASPWWAWPLDLKPVWFEGSSADGTFSAIHDGGNVVLWWLAIAAMAFAAWQAFRRRSLGLGLVVVAFFWLWLAWSRVDRAAFEYHFYAALPFFLLGLAYFLAELWHGPSPRTWLLARVAVAGVLLLPAILWLTRPQLCGLAGVDTGDYFRDAVCGARPGDLGLPAWLVPGLAAVGIVGSWFALTARHPRRLVVGVCALAALFFAFDYPDLAAVWLPTSVQSAYSALTPTWQYGFQFSTNLEAFSPVQLIGPGSAGLVLLALVVAAAAAWLPRMLAPRIRARLSRGE